MTLIAAFTHSSHPIVVGDLLVSSDMHPPYAPHVPTIGFTSRVTFPPNARYSIAGLKQKLALVSEHCVLGWSGSEYSAKEILGHLHDRALNQRIDYDTLVKVIQDFESDIRQSEPGPERFRVAFVGFLLEQNDVIRQVSFGLAVEFQTKLTGPVFAAGTGAPEFEKLLTSTEDTFPALAQQLPPKERAISHAATMMAALLTAEITSKSPLLSYYGGGYELATLHGGRFHKLSDMTYVTWQLQEKRGGILIYGRVTIISHRYVNDILVVRSADIDFDPDTEDFKITSDSVHCVFPVFRDELTTEESKQLQTPPFFTTTAVCHSIVIGLLNDCVDVSFFFEARSDGSSGSITLKENDDGSVNFGVRPEFLRSLLERIRR